MSLRVIADERFSFCIQKRCAVKASILMEISGMISHGPIMRSIGSFPSFPRRREESGRVIPA
jgi:hypothetical protein